MRTLPRALALSGLALAALAGCGSDESSTPDTVTPRTTPASVATTVGQASTTAAGTDDSATTDDTVATDTAAADSATTGTADSTAASGSVDPDAPQRIVSLSPTATETLFAIGAGAQVVAVDELSDFPEEAAAVRTDLSGYTPNVEAIASYEPDLVIHDGTQGIDAQLEELGIETLIGEAPSSFDDIYAQIEELGATTGHAEAAADLVEQMQAEIEAAVDSVEVLFEVPPRIYHELDATLFSINSNTFIGQVYALFDLQNIADTAEGGSDYPQLSAEFVISQNPDIIFLADAKCCGETPDKVAARPGWDSITAVQTGHVIPVDEDIASRWGPRIVDYVEFVADAINDLRPSPVTTASTPVTSD